MNIESAQDAALKVWKVIIDSAMYSFNSSHSVAVALDALYGAYLKAHYPMEYYSTLLDSYANAGNKEKVSSIKAEMKKAFGIVVAPCRYRQDNRGFCVDKENLRIADALHSVKYISKTIANELYRMRNDHFDTFTDLLYDLSGRRAFNSRSIKILIRMGYFEEFGSVGKLLAVFDEFSEGKNKVTKALVDKTKLKRLEALRAYEACLPEQNPSIEEQMAFEVEHYGTPITVSKEAKMKFVALDVETKFSPKLKMYSIATGQVGQIKILKKDFNELPIQAGDVIKIHFYNKKPAYSYSGGQKHVIPGVQELWVSKYDIIYRKEEEETA